MLNEYLDSLGMEIVPSTTDHIPDSQLDNDLLWDRIQQPEHEANTLLDGDRPVGLAGYQRVNDYTAEVWSILIDDTYGKTFFKCVKYYVDQVYSVRFQRLQSIVDADDEASQKWDERLGFEKESVLKAFHENDHIMYRMIR